MIEAQSALRRTLTFTIRIAVVASLLGVGGVAQQSALDVFIRRRMVEGHVPGLAAAIVKGDQVVWAKGYGLRDVQLGLPVEPQTPFMLASISKTVTASALMQLAESQAFGLDEDIDPYLPFAVNNPNHVAAPITFRHLLSHVSGIRDNWGVMMSLYVSGDSPLQLGRFLGEYLVPGGLYYSANANFAPWASGTQFQYSNMGYALNGYLVETIGGLPFDRYCEQNIFAPLGMQSTSWRFADFVPTDVAMPHKFNAQSGTYTPYGQYGYPDYPNGGLRSSVLDLSKFLLAHMNGGSHAGTRILQTATVQEMHTVQYPLLNATQGLAFYGWNFHGWSLLGHGDGDQGVYTEMWFRPADGVGVVLFANGDAVYAPMFGILARLFDEAARL